MARQRNTSLTRMGFTLILVLCVFFILVYMRNANRADLSVAGTDNRKTNTGQKAFGAPPPEKQEEVKKEYCYGIDISQWNGEIAKDIELTDSLTFIICKATEGEDYTDPEFSFNWKTIKEKKLIRGTYHFYHSNDDPGKQVDFFLSVVKQFDSADMAPIVDIEEASLPGKQKISNDQLQSDLLKFLELLEAKTGRLPVIYTDLTFANKYLVNEKLARYPLWLAEYSGNTSPEIPVTWKQTGYMIWQKTDKYNLKSHAVDYDVYYGAKAGLLK